MAERSAKIAKGVDDAKKSSELLQQATLEYEQNTMKLKKLAVESQKELSKELEKLRSENLDRIKKDNEEWIKKRTEQMEIDKKALVEGAKGELASLAILAARKIIEEKTESQIKL